MTELLPPDRIATCAAILERGGTVAMPTETVYGLAAVCDSETAVRSVFRAKGRPADHPLIIHVSSPGMAARYGMLTDTAMRLIDCFWPGPLTVLVERTDEVPDAVTGGRDTVALRMPAHATALALIDAVGRGLVAPSANRFGHVSPTTAAHVMDDLDGSIDAVIDAGPCGVGIESTIVDCIARPQVLRHGAVTGDDIEDCLGLAPDEAAGPSRAPGMLASHYAPDAGMVLCSDVTSMIEAVARLRAEGHTVEAIGAGLTAAEYAAGLYGLMRSAEKSGADIIVALVPDGDGIAAAVRDRLMKAAAPR
ncbi:MAG: L-threonylcarbamoyladenylate synthase [Ilumatobacteraceae bacterium]